MWLTLIFFLILVYIFFLISGRALVMMLIRRRVIEPNKNTVVLLITPFANIIVFICAVRLLWRETRYFEALADKFFEVKGKYYEGESPAPNTSHEM